MARDEREDTAVRQYTARLQEAPTVGVDVRVRFAVLSTPELHMARVRSRVARGAHDSPEAKIRERYDRSRIHLIEVMARLTELRMVDNSFDAAPYVGGRPRPALILHLVGRTIVQTIDLADTPRWARPLVAAAIKVAT